MTTVGHSPLDKQSIQLDGLHILLSLICKIQRNVTNTTTHVAFARLHIVAPTHLLQHAVLREEILELSQGVELVRKRLPLDRMNQAVHANRSFEVLVSRRCRQRKGDFKKNNKSRVKGNNAGLLRDWAAYVVLQPQRLAASAVCTNLTCEHSLDRQMVGTHGHIEQGTS